MSIVSWFQKTRTGTWNSKPNNSVHIWPGVGSLRHLTEAAKADGIDPALVKSWEAVNGKIHNSYFTKTRNGCVVITQVHSRFSLRSRRQVLVWAGDHNIALQVREFDDALTRSVWMARETERGTDRLLPRRNRKVVANLIFTVLVPLLRSLSVVAHQHNNVPVANEGQNVLLRAARSANRRMDAIERYVRDVELQTAVRYYLYGLPLGFAVIIPLVLLFGHVWEGVGADPNRFLAVAITGGLGSITSVMMRITRGQNLTVNPRQGPVVTVVSGAFRSLVGAVFGIALYLLVQGDLLPLDVSAEHESLWYTGLAFLAGFSERWAQDTIVKSTPISPSPITTDEDLPGAGGRTRPRTRRSKRAKAANPPDPG